MIVKFEKQCQGLETAELRAVLHLQQWGESGEQNKPLRPSFPTDGEEERGPGRQRNKLSLAPRLLAWRCSRKTKVFILRSELYFYFNT